MKHEVSWITPCSSRLCRNSHCVSRASAPLTRSCNLSSTDSRSRMMSPSRASGSPGQETFAVPAECALLPRSNGLPPPLGERWLVARRRAWAGIRWLLRPFPIGQFKVGSIAADRTGLLLTDPRSEQWARPEWVRQESIACFAGQPLVFRDETLGVACGGSDGNQSMSRNSVGYECLRIRRQRPSQTPARSQNSTGCGNSSSRTMVPERGGRQRPELWPNRRPQPRASSCIATSRRSGIDGCDGADYRRVW